MSTATPARWASVGSERKRVQSSRENVVTVELLEVENSAFLAAVSSG
jgi:hypothetical protein